MGAIDGPRELLYSPGLESLARPLLASASDPMIQISCMPVSRAIHAQAKFSHLLANRERIHRMPEFVS
jgi:hypothetical protein